MTLADAVRTIKRLQPEFDARKEDEKLLDAAKKTLGAHMIEKGIDTYRGIALRVVEYGAWDDAKVREHLGDRAEEFRTKRPRRFFSIVGRARKV